MATTAQILANRNNSQKSTGPQTDEGKATVSQNAVKHGLFAAEAVISGEDPADYELSRDKYLAELLPVGMIESVLAERIVSLSWRLQRAERIQNEVFENMIEQNVTDQSAIRSWKDHCYDEDISSEDPRFNPDHLALGRIAQRDWGYCRTLDRLLLYERRIENSLYKTINRLKQYQVIRRIEHAETRKPSTSLRDEDATRPNPTFPKDEAAARRVPVDKFSDLQKQSQFAAAHLIAKPLMKEDYNNSTACGDEENKANQSQIHADEQAKGAGTREKSVAAANSLTG